MKDKVRRLLRQQGQQSYNSLEYDYLIILLNGREMDCEYSDGLSPTRTELLEEHLGRLQARVQELESQQWSGQPSSPSSTSITSSFTGFSHVAGV